MDDDQATVGARLRRDLGLGGAVVTGLGSILGTGVFVSIAVAAGFAGEWVLLAVPLAGLVATFNGLSSAQLAAAHPVSGGTYEYGYRFLNPWLGFAAGWLFLVAKTASASSAALGFGGYLLAAIGASAELLVPVAVAAGAAVTVLVLSGIRRTAGVNYLLVAVTVAALGVFILLGLVTESPFDAQPPTLAGVGPSSVLEAIAFLFVAYTGYGRIATLGEEVRDPARIIPRAVVITLAVSALLYFGVAWAGLRLAGPVWFAQGGPEPTTAAPLTGVAPAWSGLIELGALLAMLGVLLNLVLGLSRVWLAMGRRGDMPPGLGSLVNGTPRAAVMLTGAAVIGVALVGDIRLTWEFSAFSVLLYYALTNLAAMRLRPEQRRFPRWVPWAGLASCLFLSFWVQPGIWLTGAGVLVAGLTWRAAYTNRTSAIG